MFKMGKQINKQFDLLFLIALLGRQHFVKMLFVLLKPQNVYTINSLMILGQLELHWDFPPINEYMYMGTYYCSASTVQCIRILPYVSDTAQLSKKVKSWDKSTVVIKKLI